MCVLARCGVVQWEYQQNEQNKYSVYLHRAAWRIIYKNVYRCCFSLLFFTLYAYLFSMSCWFGCHIYMYACKQKYGARVAHTKLWQIYTEKINWTNDRVYSICLVCVYVDCMLKGIVNHLCCCCCSIIPLLFLFS